MIPHHIESLYSIIPLTPFRKTEGVLFDLVPADLIPRISSIDRVLHADGAVSPGPVGGVDRPWYMHPAQDDNLIVLHGARHVDIYTPAHGKIESFVVTPDKVLYEDEIIFEGGAMLVWPRNVFHRIVSGKGGSASLNFAVHYDGWDAKTNFNIYDLDSASGEYRTLREGFKDQV